MRNFVYHLFIVVFILQNTSTFSQETMPRYEVFSFEQQLTLPGNPEKIYDAITGDISGWWDHSFSEKPYKLYIEAKPGGGFYEIFNESGDGVKHATVTIAERGKMLRFEGPLGLSGMAVNLVNTYKFEPVGKDSTRLQLSVHGAGEVPEGIPAIVESVWHHFLFERFKPYIEEGRYKK
jgi:hypothetical protein